LDLLFPVVRAEVLRALFHHARREMYTREIALTLTRGSLILARAAHDLEAVVEHPRDQISASYKIRSGDKT
jgi:hypothetical protein